MALRLARFHAIVAVSELPDNLRALPVRPPERGNVFDFASAYARRRGPSDFRPRLTKRQLANHLGKSTRWVELRVREGMPAGWDERQLERRFDLADVTAWISERAA